MIPTDPAVVQALEQLSDATAVVYLSGMDTPTPVTKAGTHDGKTYYIAGTGPHVIGPDTDCEVDRAVRWPAG